MLVSALEGIGLDKNKFGLHSIRSGGATAAAAAGIYDRLLKQMNVGRVSRRKVVMLSNLLRTDYLLQKMWVFKCFLLAFYHSNLIAQLIFPLSLHQELCCTLSGELIL